MIRNDFNYLAENLLSHQGLGDTVQRAHAISPNPPTRLVGMVLQAGQWDEV